MPLKVIAFDADDTLWVNEPFFREAEAHFCELMADFLPFHDAERELLTIEIRNIALYGYGIKGFTLSMVETALHITGGQIDSASIGRLIDLGKSMMARPVELLPGVEEVLAALKGRYRLVVATKGDLVDQERKLRKSGIEHYFHHIEVMSEKAVPDYRKLIRHLDIEPAEMMMIGNSLKSDVVPVLTLGGHAVHVPFHTTWIHEVVAHHVEHPNLHRISSLAEVLPLLA
jgi:putative hydrolase of the HAD superfamily